jgi:hypothetical protein
MKERQSNQVNYTEPDEDGDESESESESNDDSSDESDKDEENVIPKAKLAGRTLVAKKRSGGLRSLFK